MRLDLTTDPDEARRLALDGEQAARDGALDQVAEHANDDWVEYARYVIRHVARTRRTFIIDAIWEAGLPKPPEARAIGSIIRDLGREGVIEATQDFIPSAQRGNHCVPRRVWRSLIFEETA